MIFRLSPQFNPFGCCLLGLLALPLFIVLLPLIVILLLIVLIFKPRRLIRIVPGRFASAARAPHAGANGEHAPSSRGYDNGEIIDTTVVAVSDEPPALSDGSSKPANEEKPFDHGK